MALDDTGPAFVPRAAAEMAAATKAHPYAAVGVAAGVAAVGAWKAFGLFRAGGPVDRMSTQATRAVKNVVRDWTAEDTPEPAKSHSDLRDAAAPGPRKVLITPNLAQPAAGDD